MLADVMQAANMNSVPYETGAGQFSLSASGSLAYVPGGIYPEGEGTIVSVDRRRGTAQTLSVPLHPYYSPRLNPRDPSQLVVWTQGVDRNVWTLDIVSGTLTHLTTSGRTSKAIWTPDGKRITFAGSSAGADNLFWMPAGGGTAEPLTTGGLLLSPGSWSPDGRTLAFVRVQAETGMDVMAMSVDGDRRPTAILATRFNEAYPEFSPDGRYLAYVSNDTDTNEVYVQPYPGPGPRKRISNQGGSEPAWSQDRRELFYWMSTDSGRRMMAVPITTTPTFKVLGAPQPLFEGRYGSQALVRGYDVTADGQRFYFVQSKERPPVRAAQMIFVQNWFEELKAKMPGGVAK
jgi:Tol biopolymer transport system component